MRHEAPLRLCLIRHGRTQWNKELIFRGGADVPLDAAGMAQARALAERLRPAGIVAVYSGPLQRARRTAELLAAPHALPVTLLPGLDDMRFGSWEGRPVAAVRRTQPALFGLWQRQPWRLRIPGGTTLRQIGARSMRALRGIVRQHRGGQTVVIVTHRVVLKLLMLRLLGASSAGFWRVALDPCSLTVFDWDGSDFTLQRFNDTGHLKRRGGQPDF